MNYDACRELTRANSKSFYFASFPLPPAKRNATYATYAFCRTADDIVDECSPGAEDGARRQLVDLRALLDAMERGETPDHPYWGPLSDAIRTFGIPMEPFRSLLDGVESDLQCRQFQTFQELRHYCHQVASTVGVALSHIFGFDDSQALDYAANMGVAMQLTNIIRDVGTDYRLGRVYLPADELAEFGVTVQQIAAGDVDERFRALMRFQITRAREYYRRAFQGIRYLTRDGSHWTALLMGDVYRQILTQVERNDYDVFRLRASTTFGGKLIRTAMAPVVFGRDVLANTSPFMTFPEEHA